jgi:ribosomal protein S19E (S16A)
MNAKTIKQVKLQICPTSGSLIQSKRRETPFLKGPVDLELLQQAAILPGKALNVYLALHWLTDMSYGAPVKLGSKVYKLFGFSADAARDALKRLEAVGLIACERVIGRKTRIWLIK